MNNPLAKLPSLQNIPSPSQLPASTSPPDITRQTESSKEKSRTQEKANIALEILFEHLMLEDHSRSEYSFISTNTDDPKTVDEALTGPEAEERKRGNRN